MSMSQYLDRLNGNNYLQNDKQTYTVTANQYLAWPDITMYLSATHKTYWNDVSSNNYGVSVSKIFDIGSFKGISTTISANKVKYQYESENQVFFSFSVPIGVGQQVSYDAQHDKNNGYSQNISYFNSQDPRNIWRVSAGGPALKYSKEMACSVVAINIAPLMVSLVLMPAIKIMNITH